jgi:hypothetical protein
MSPGGAGFEELQKPGENDTTWVLAPFAPSESKRFLMGREKAAAAPAFVARDPLSAAVPANHEMGLGTWPSQPARSCFESWFRRLHFVWPS